MGSYQASAVAQQQSSKPTVKRGYHYGDLLKALPRMHAISSTARVVLAIMVDCTDSREGETFGLCVRSVRYLSAHSGKSERSVQRALREIEDSGVYTRIRNGRYVPGQEPSVSAWVLNLTRLRELCAMGTAMWEAKKEDGRRRSHLRLVHSVDIVQIQHSKGSSSGAQSDKITAVSTPESPSSARQGRHPFLSGSPSSSSHEPEALSPGARLTPAPPVAGVVQGQGDRPGQQETVRAGVQDPPAASADWTESLTHLETSSWVPPQASHTPHLAASASRDDHATGSTGNATLKPTDQDPTQLRGPSPGAGVNRSATDAPRTAESDQAARVVATSRKAPVKWRGSPQQVAMAKGRAVDKPDDASSHDDWSRYYTEVILYTIRTELGSTLPVESPHATRIADAAVAINVHGTKLGVVARDESVSDERLARAVTDWIQKVVLSGAHKDPQWLARALEDFIRQKAAPELL